MNNVFLLGTILAWVPKPNKNSAIKKNIPDCWVECDGGTILKGIWEGQTTPDLNNAQRFLRGGPQANVLETQEDALQQHEHYANDPGHIHSYKDSFVSMLFQGDSGVVQGHWGPEHGDKVNDRFDDSRDHNSAKSYSGVRIQDVKSARVSSETRPKNMKVTFIMKVC